MRQILERCEFNTDLALCSINEQYIAEIEDYANKNPYVLKNTIYENVQNFKFKPGHKAVIRQLPNQIELMKKAKSSQNLPTTNSDFSFMLKTFIDTAESNYGSEFNRSFQEYFLY